MYYTFEQKILDFYSFEFLMYSNTEIAKHYSDSFNEQTFTY